MVYAETPITVNSVSLDGVAWNVESKVRSWPGSRAADVVIPGVDGEAASVNDDLEATTWTINMWLMGTDETGVIPFSSSAMAECRKNLDTLSFLFLGQRHALLDVRETVDRVGSIRQVWCKVIDSVSPDIKPGGLGRFSVILKVPDALAQDVNTQDWQQTGITAGVSYEVTTLQGSSGPINDAIFLLTGPATNPQINDTTSSAFVRFNGVLASGDAWRVNSDTWTSRYGSSVVLGSSDVTGTSADSITRSGGGNSRLLRLTPSLQSGLRRVRVNVTGTVGGSTLSIRARRKFLQ